MAREEEEPREEELPPHEPVWKHCVDLRESPRRRADAIAATTSRRWRRIATMSSRRSYGLQPVASMAWGAQNLIPTQA